jgi:hypothetical protein
LQGQYLKLYKAVTSLRIDHKAKIQELRGNMTEQHKNEKTEIVKTEE